VAAQLKDLPSTINIGKKSVPDQLPPNVSKINFDLFRKACAQQSAVNLVVAINKNAKLI
jgi:hypothetical protein